MELLQRALATAGLVAFPRADLDTVRALTRTAARLLPGLARFFGCTFARVFRLAMIDPSRPAVHCADPALGHCRHQQRGCSFKEPPALRTVKQGSGSILRRSCLSADVLGPLLLLGLLLCLGGGWELQHCCVLTFRKFGQKDLLTVRHFKDIVMHSEGARYSQHNAQYSRYHDQLLTDPNR